MTPSTLRLEEAPRSNDVASRAIRPWQIVDVDGCMWDRRTLATQGMAPLCSASEDYPRARRGHEAPPLYRFFCRALADWLAWPSGDGLCAKHFAERLDLTNEASEAAMGQPNTPGQGMSSPTRRAGQRGPLHSASLARKEGKHGQNPSGPGGGAR